MKKLLICLCTITCIGLACAATTTGTVSEPSATSTNDVALRSNQKLTASNGDYLYLYTNKTFSLDASNTIGACYNGTYSFRNSNETIVLTYTSNGESASWSGRVTMIHGKISSVTILGQTFRSR